MYEVRFLLEIEKTDFINLQLKVIYHDLKLANFGSYFCAAWNLITTIFSPDYSTEFSI